MAKNAYFYIKQAIRSSLKERMIAWRAGESIETLDKPTDIGKARMLGYKDKKGFIMVRVRVVRGGRKRNSRKKGRRSKRQTIRKTLMINYRAVAEQRAQKKFPNLEVLNSYQIGKDGQHYFFEIILVDPQMPEIKSDKQVNFLCKDSNKNRALRGRTSAYRN